MLINPLWVFYLLNGLLIAGACALWDRDGYADMPVEIIWICAFSILLFVGNLILQKKNQIKINLTELTMTPESELFCIIVLFLVATLFVSRGIPIFSSNPNIARVEFFAEGTVYAKSFALLPAIIAMATIVSGTPNSSRALIYGAIACLEVILVGNKQSPFTIGFPILAGFWCIGRRIPASLIFAGGVLATILLLYLFSHVTNETEASQGAWELLWLRVSETNEEGLRVCVENADALGAGPALIGFQSLFDRLGGRESGYPVSTGRYISTMVLNYKDYYDAVWEYTVTGFCDSYLLGGHWGIAIYCVLIVGLVLWTLTLMRTAKTGLERGLAILFFTHIFTLHNGGNIVAQILGFISQAWILAGAILLGAWILTQGSRAKSRSVSG